MRKWRPDFVAANIIFPPLLVLSFSCSDEEPGEEEGEEINGSGNN